MESKTIVLHTNQIDFRGTTKAIYDYALGLRERGHKVRVISKPNVNSTALQKFQDSNLDFHVYKDNLDLYNLTDKFEYIYKIQYGNVEPCLVNGKKELIHAVFEASTPYGHRYAAVSEWLGKRDGVDFVPHIVKYNKSTKVGLQSKLMVGYHGGSDSFDIDFVQNTIKKVLEKRDDIVFSFLGTTPIIPNHPNIIYYPASDIVNEFITCCDCMLHARSRGETFGLSVAEFALAGKPILSWDSSPERAHIEHLKNDPGLILYNNADDLEQHLMNINKDTKGCDPKSMAKFSTENVMNQFEKVFLS